MYYYWHHLVDAHRDTFRKYHARTTIAFGDRAAKYLIFFQSFMNKFVQNLHHTNDIIISNQYDSMFTRVVDVCVYVCAFCKYRQTILRSIYGNRTSSGCPRVQTPTSRKIESRRPERQRESEAGVSKLFTHAISSQADVHTEHAATATHTHTHGSRRGNAVLFKLNKQTPYNPIDVRATHEISNAYGMCMCRIILSIEKI